MTEIRTAGGWGRAANDTTPRKNREANLGAKKKVINQGGRGAEGPWGWPLVAANRKLVYCAAVVVPAH
jgi:hypothetical protein